MFELEKTRDMSPTRLINGGTPPVCNIEVGSILSASSQLSESNKTEVKTENLVKNENSSFQATSATVGTVINLETGATADPNANAKTTVILKTGEASSPPPPSPNEAISNIVQITSSNTFKNGCEQMLHCNPTSDLSSMKTENSIEKTDYLKDLSALNMTTTKSEPDVGADQQTGNEEERKGRAIIGRLKISLRAAELLFGCCVVRLRRCDQDQDLQQQLYLKGKNIKNRGPSRTKKRVCKSKRSRMSKTKEKVFKILAHEANANSEKQKKIRVKQAEGFANDSKKSKKCPKCNRCFAIQLALHNHLRSHRRRKANGTRKFKPKTNGQLLWSGSTSNQNSLDLADSKKQHNKLQHNNNNKINPNSEKKRKLTERKKNLKKITHLGLVNRMRVHSDNQPYKCTVCGLGFASSSNRRRHMRIKHPDVIASTRGYKCSICGKRFMSTVDLKSHLLQHEGVKLYCCNLCGLRYTDSSNLNRHKKSSCKGKGKLPITSLEKV